MQSEIREFIKGAGRPTEVSQNLWEIIACQENALRDFIGIWGDEPKWSVLLAHAWDSMRLDDWTNFPVNVPKLGIRKIEEKHSRYTPGILNLRVAVASSLLHVSVYAGPGVHPLCALSDASNSLVGQPQIHESMYSKKFIQFWKPLLPQLQSWWDIDSSYCAEMAGPMSCEVHKSQNTGNSGVLGSFIGGYDTLHLSSHALAPVGRQTYDVENPELTISQISEAFILIQSGSYASWMAAIRNLQLSQPTMVRVDIQADNEIDDESNVTLGYWLVLPRNLRDPSQKNLVTFVRDKDLKRVATTVSSSAYHGSE